MSDQRAGAERQILNLLSRYAESVDDGDFGAVSALFEHADYHLQGARGQRGGSVGDLMRRTIITYDGSPRTKHVTTNAIIELGTDAEHLTATCRSYFSVMQATPTLPLQPIITGRYHDRFDCVDGTWRFAERTIIIEQIGDISGHLSPGVLKA